MWNANKEAKKKVKQKLYKKTHLVLDIIIINNTLIELKSYTEFLLFTDKETLLQL
jgi:hypothetical protein